MAYLEKRIALDHDRDSDIIEFFDSMTSHKANQIVRDLLRDYIENERESRLDRIENKLNIIIRTLNSAPVSFSSNTNEDNVDDISLLERNLLNIGV